MALCRLCGYRVSIDTAEQQKRCPVCGEASFVGLQNGLQGVAVGLSIAMAWSGGEAQQQSQSIEKAGLRRDGSTKGLPLSCVNPELLSLLQLVPEPQHRKANTQRVVRAAGTLTPPRPVDTPPTDSNAVYIRPHADPLRYLKGRYNTQTRIARAASVSALHRLADPLTGHDSIEALAPQDRRRREERIKRLMESRHERGKRNDVCGRAGHVLKETRSSVNLQRVGGKVVPSQRSLSRSNSSSIGASAKSSPIMKSVDAVRRQRRNSTDSTGLGVERERDQQRRLKTSSESATRDVGVRPSHPRKSARRRTEPILHRKRVATMRSVDGWVREVDPSSARRRLSLERRGPIVDKNSENGGKPTTENGKEDSFGCSEAKRHSIGGCGIFLTEIDPNNSCPRESGHVSTGSGKGSRGSARGNGCRTDRFGFETVVGEKAARETSRVRFEEREKLAAPLVVKTERKGLKRTTNVWRDCRGGAGKQRSRTAKRVVGSFRHTQQQIPPPTRAFHPSGGRNASAGSPEKRIAWGRPTRAPEGTCRTVSDCELSVGEPLATRGPGQPEAASGDQNNVYSVSSSQRPDAVFSPEGEVVHKATSASERAKQGDPQWGLLAPATSQRPASAINLTSRHMEDSAKAGRPRSSWQCLRDTCNDWPAGPLMRVFDDNIRAAATATVVSARENPRAASAASTTRPTSLSRRNGRDRQRQTESYLAVEARQRLGSIYGKHGRTLPTLLVDLIEESDSPKLSNPPAQKVARSQDEVRCRGRRRSNTQEPTGLMQRLDRNPVTAGNVLVAGLGGNCRRRGEVSTQNLSRRFGSGAWGAVEIEDGPPVWGSGSYRGKILASAVPEPLLHVGRGYGFKLRR